MGPQGTDSSLDPTLGNGFSRRIRFWPPRGSGRPKTPRFFTKTGKNMEKNIEILENFRGVSGPGVAGNGFSSKNHYQKWDRDSNLCPGDPFRGHFPFFGKTVGAQPPPGKPTSLGASRFVAISRCAGEATETTSGARGPNQSTQILDYGANHQWRHGGVVVKGELIDLVFWFFV